MKLARNNRNTLSRSKLALEALEARTLLSAAVWTDKPDYAPGETAIIYGSGFNVGETVRLHVMHEDGTVGGDGHLPWSVTDGASTDADGLANGSIESSWYVNPDDSVGATFVVTAMGLGSPRFAQASFTDDGPEPPAVANSIAGVKFYDSNGDGVRDPDGPDDVVNTADDEPPINGWLVNLYLESNGDAGLQVGAGGDTFIRAFTTATVRNIAGAYLFSNLTPSTTNPYYVVEDGVPTSFTGAWVQTLPATNGPVGSGIYQLPLPTNASIRVDFGNVKLTDGGGLSKGFWTNHPELVTSGDLAALSALNLRNDDGAHFNPTSVSELSTWMSGGGSNMAKKLSAQLAAMTLNVRHGEVGETIYAPGAEGANSLGFVSMTALMADADNALAANGNPSGSDKDFQEALKNSLEGWNNTSVLSSVAGLVFVNGKWVAPF